MDDSNKHRKQYNYKKPQKPVSAETYRFRRVLGDILKFLKSLPTAEDFAKAQNQYVEQITELIQKGFTWGFEYSIPVHETDFGTLQKKEWAAIRAIVRKQDFKGHIKKD